MRHQSLGLRKLSSPLFGTLNRERDAKKLNLDGQAWKAKLELNLYTFTCYPFTCRKELHYPRMLCSEMYRVMQWLGLYPFIFLTPTWDRFFSADAFSSCSLRKVTSWMNHSNIQTIITKLSDFLICLLFNDQTNSFNLCPPPTHRKTVDKKR